jgi:hypothetical protein
MQSQPCMTAALCPPRGRQAPFHGYISGLDIVDGSNLSRSGDIV